MQTLTAQNLKSFLDAHPVKYKTGNVEADGYLPTTLIGELLGQANPVANPISVAPQVPKPWTGLQILQAVSQGDRAKCVAAGVIVGIQDAIVRQDAQGILEWAQLCLDDALISQAEHDAIAGVVSATQADPTWTAMVPGPTDLLSQFGVHSIQIFQSRDAGGNILPADQQPVSIAFALGRGE